MDYTYEIKIDNVDVNEVSITTTSEVTKTEVLNKGFIFDGKINGFDNNGDLHFIGLSSYRNVYLKPINSYGFYYDMVYNANTQKQ